MARVINPAITIKNKWSFYFIQSKNQSKLNKINRCIYLAIHQDAVVNLLEAASHNEMLCVMQEGSLRINTFPR